MRQGKPIEDGHRRAYQVNGAAAAYRLSRSTLYNPVEAIEALVVGNDR